MYKRHMLLSVTEQLVLQVHIWHLVQELPWGCRLEGEGGLGGPPPGLPLQINFFSVVHYLNGFPGPPSIFFFWIYPSCYLCLGA